MYKICIVAINFNYRPFQPHFPMILHQACEACSHHGKLRCILNGWSVFYYSELQHAATKLSMVHASKARPGAPRAPRSAASSCTRGSCRTGRGPWLNMAWNGFEWFPNGLLTQYEQVLNKFFIAVNCPSNTQNLAGEAPNKLIVIHSKQISARHRIYGGNWRHIMDYHGFIMSRELSRYTLICPRNGATRSADLADCLTVSNGFEWYPIAWSRYE